MSHALPVAVKLQCSTFLQGFYRGHASLVPQIYLEENVSSLLRKYLALQCQASRVPFSARKEKRKKNKSHDNDPIVAQVGFHTLL